MIDIFDIRVENSFRWMLIHKSISIIIIVHRVISGECIPLSSNLAYS